MADDCANDGAALSLIPTFGVPLFIMLHVISIAQARRWKKLQYEYVEEQLPASA